MKTPTYREAVEWIAVNDDPDETRAARIAQNLTVQLVADLFALSTVTVARDIARVRKDERIR